MRHPTPQQLDLHLAWQFTEVLPGTFERDRKEVAGIKFPIVGPLPSAGKATPPMEGRDLVGPYLYLLFSRAGSIKYVGVATEEGLASPLERWIRPNREKTKDYWAHGTNKKSKSTVSWLAEGLAAGEGPFSLYFSNLAHFTKRMRIRSQVVGQSFAQLEMLAPRAFVEAVEHALIYAFQPDWNNQKKKSRPPSHVAACAEYWQV